jgi:putative ABC transport system substrate-binding protein
MRRREFIALAGASVAWPFAAMAQEPGRIYRIGVLVPFARDSPTALRLFDELRRSGFIEGQNLTIHYRDCGLHGDLISQYATELVKAEVDVIQAGGGVAIHAAQHATSTIPIVGVATDMVAEGFVGSMARPSGNITGISLLNTELDGKRQDILIDAVPGIRRMAALADSGLLTETTARALQDAAHARSIDLDILRITKGGEIAAALEKAHASGATALNVLSSDVLWTNRRLIMDRAATLRRGIVGAS